MCAWLHVVPLVSRVGPTVLVSQEVVPQRGLPFLGRSVLTSRSGQVGGLGPQRDCRSGGDPVRVNFAYAFLLWRVVRLLVYLVVLVLPDSKTLDRSPVSNRSLALRQIGHSYCG